MTLRLFIVCHGKPETNSKPFIRFVFCVWCFQVELVVTIEEMESFDILLPADASAGLKELVRGCLQTQPGVTTQDNA